jgi:hypothetical protein
VSPEIVKFAAESKICIEPSAITFPAKVAAAFVIVN